VENKRADQADEKRVTISVNLSTPARRIIDGIRADTGIPNTTAMEQILEWFAGLDVKLRLAVLVRDEETKQKSPVSC
jgi:hypothetical protein